jgi:hypothetical protein
MSKAVTVAVIALCYSIISHHDDGSAHRGGSRFVVVSGFNSGSLILPSKMKNYLSSTSTSLDTTRRGDDSFNYQQQQARRDDISNQSSKQQQRRRPPPTHESSMTTFQTSSSSRSNSNKVELSRMNDKQHP